MAFQSSNSAWLYLKSKDYLPGHPESLFEMGYLLYKRLFIFLISGIFFAGSSGMVTLYLNLFGSSISSILKDTIEVDETNDLMVFLTSK
jgi:hypothetical protein